MIQAPTTIYDLIWIILATLATIGIAAIGFVLKSILLKMDTMNASIGDLNTHVAVLIEKQNHGEKEAGRLQKQIDLIKDELNTLR